MKTLAAILGLLFVLVVSSHSYACDCEHAKKPSTDSVADNKKDASSGKSCGSESCACGKSGACDKNCSCGSHEGKNHKPSCTCDHHKKAKS